MFGNGCIEDYTTILTNATGVASAAWPAANRAIFIPFKVDVATEYNRFLLSNGATAAGNFDAGIYDGLTLARLASTGSTPQAGTSVFQSVNFTAAVTLQPGMYYWAVAMDGTTGTVFRVSAIDLEMISLWGIRQMAAAFPLPATAVLANPGTSFYFNGGPAMTGFPL